MRRTVVSILGVVGATAGMMLLSSATAHACEQGHARDGRVAVCPGDEMPGEEPVDHVPGEDWTPPDDWTLAEWQAPGSQDGQPCIEHHAQWMHEDDVTAHLNARGIEFFRWHEGLPYEVTDGNNDEHPFGACEAQPEDAGLPPQMVVEAIQTWLPLPEPVLDPGWALTGLPSYLEIGAEATFEDVVLADELPVEVVFDAWATYRVDWGDGTVTEHQSPGGAYPDGDITHTYTDAIDRTVTVTPVWNVSAQAPGQTFEFDGIELVASSVDLPVRELQSVRTSSR